MRIYFFEDLGKLKIQGKTLDVEEDDRDEGNTETWSTNSADEEVCKPTHGVHFAANTSEEAKGGKCFMVKGTSSKSQRYYS